MHWFETRRNDEHVTLELTDQEATALRAGCFVRSASRALRKAPPYDLDEEIVKNIDAIEERGDIQLQLQAGDLEHFPFVLRAFADGINSRRTENHLFRGLPPEQVGQTAIRLAYEIDAAKAAQACGLHYLVEEILIDSAPK